LNLFFFILRTVNRKKKQHQIAASYQLQNKFKQGDLQINQSYETSFFSRHKQK